MKKVLLVMIMCVCFCADVWAAGKTFEGEAEELRFYTSVLSAITNTKDYNGDNITQTWCNVGQTLYSQPLQIKNKSGKFSIKGRVDAKDADSVPTNGTASLYVMGEYGGKLTRYVRPLNTNPSGPTDYKSNILSGITDDLEVWPSYSAPWAAYYMICLTAATGQVTPIFKHGKH